MLKETKKITQKQREAKIEKHEEDWKLVVLENLSTEEFSKLICAVCNDLFEVMGSI